MCVHVLKSVKMFLKVSVPCAAGKARAHVAQMNLVAMY